MKQPTTLPRLATGLALAGALALAGPAGLDAQEGDVSFGIYGGGMTSSDLNSTSETEFFTDGAPAELQLETSAMIGVQGEYWFNDRIALRADGAWAPATLETDFSDEVPQGIDEPTTNVADVDVFTGDVNAVIRLLPEESTVTPFVTGGGGFVRYNPDGSAALVLDDANARIPNDEAEPQDGNASIELAGMVGVGADISPDGWPVTIRGELTDHIGSSPAELYIGDEDILPGGADVEGDNEFDAVHNLQLSLGLQWFPGQS